MDGRPRGQPPHSVTAPLLILDTYLEPAGAAPDLRALVGARPVQVVRPPFGDALPADPSPFAALLLSGSVASTTDESLSWLPPLRAFVRQALEQARPILGICFGHQLLAQAALGFDVVRRSPTPELGFGEIELVGEHPLLDGIERRFTCFVSHFDEVHAAPGELEVFARSPDCAIHGFQVPGKPAIGVQFHPEMPPAECDRLVREYLPQVDADADPDAVLASAVDGRPLGRRLMANFFRWSEAGIRSDEEPPR